MREFVMFVIGKGTSYEKNIEFEERNPDQETAFQEKSKSKKAKSQYYIY